MRPLRIRTALSPDFVHLPDSVRDIWAAATTAGVTAATEGFKLTLRQQIFNADLGNRLPNAVGSRVYPEGRPSLSATGSVFSRGKRADMLLTGLAEGRTIRAQGTGGSATFLAIPTPAAGSARITPGQWESNTGLRLRFVYRRGRPSLLVVDNATVSRSGRARANVGRRKGAAFTRLTGRTTVVIFILVPQVTLRQRLQPLGELQKWADRVPELIDRALPSDF